MAIQNSFSTILLKQPRPQTSFMYEAAEPTIINNNGIKDLLYTVYFTPDCAVCMKDLINKYGFTECPQPIRDQVIGLCTIEDYEDLVWVEN